MKDNESLNFSDNSIQRFAQACSMVSSFKTAGNGVNALDHSFSILNKVAQGDYTKWSIVYDITEKKIHFITNKNKSRRTASFNDFDFNCSTASRAIDMNETGLDNLFKNLSYEINKKLVETSVLESRPNIDIPAAVVKETVAFYNKTSCEHKK